MNFNAIEEATLWLQTPQQDVKVLLQQLQSEKDLLVERRGGISNQLSADQKQTSRTTSITRPKSNNSDKIMIS